MDLASTTFLEETNTLNLAGPCDQLRHKSILRSGKGFCLVWSRQDDTMAMMLASAIGTSETMRSFARLDGDSKNY
jgi:hypothetical protein